jgi:hypothetical protein
MTPVMDGSIQEDDHLALSRHDGVHGYVMPQKEVLPSDGY